MQQSKLPIWNVMDFGAKGDRQTRDDQAIQRRTSFKGNRNYEI